MILARVIFIAQLILMLPAFAYLLMMPMHLGTVAILFYLAPVGVLAILFALWLFIRHPARRRMAIATAATPIICLVAPTALVLLNGGPLDPDALAIAVSVLLGVAILVVIGRARHWRGTAIFTNRRFNLHYFIALGVLLALVWIPVVLFLVGTETFSLPGNIPERDRVLHIAAIYYIAVALPALCLSLLALLYAPVGLVRNAGGRLVHFGQLVMSLVLLSSLAVGAFVAVVSTFNPG